MNGTADTDLKRTRRALLSSIGAASVASTAGCLTTLPAFGQSVRYGPVDEPDAGSPVYRDWIPDDLGAADPVGALTLGFQRPGERGEETLGDPYADDRVKHWMDYVGVDFESFEYLVTVGEAVVGRAPVGAASVEETMAAAEFEWDGEYEGFDVYRSQNELDLPATTAAFGDDFVIYARSDPAAVEDVIDTGVGTRTRRQETTEAFDRLTEAFGAHPVTSFSHGREGDGDHESLAGAKGFTFDDEYAYSVNTTLYAPGTAPSREDIESHIEESPRALDATRIDVRVDEPFVTLVVKFDHETFRDLYGPLFEYPLTTWGADYDADAEELRLTHQAGDAVDASLLTLEDTRAGEPADEQFGDRYDLVEPGDSLTIGVNGRDEWHFRLDGTVPGTETRWTEFNVGDMWFDR